MRYFNIVLVMSRDLPLIIRKINKQPIKTCGEAYYRRMLMKGRLPEELFKRIMISSADGRVIL